MSLKSKNGKLLSNSGHLCTTCCSDILTILYEWDLGVFDLDTGTTFLGGIVGWACAGGAPYIFLVSGDNTSFGPEQVNVMVREAHTDGAWSSSVEILCAAGWYTPSGGSGPARIRVTFNGVSSLISISPGSQTTCASTPVAIITVHDDWTFTLVASP
jgi:hypothetical protein